MTLLCWVVDLCATFIELFLFYWIIEAIFENQKKYHSILYSLTGAVIIILFNHISLFSHLNMFVFFLVLFLGGCSIVRKELFSILSMAAFYVFCVGCFEFFYVSLLMTNLLFGKNVLSGILQLGLPRILFIITCKIAEFLLILFVRVWILKIHKEYFSTTKLFVLAIGGYVGFIYMVKQTFSSYNTDIPKLWMSIFATLLLLLFILLFEIDLRGKRAQTERELLNRTLLEEKYQSLNELYSRNAKLYHDLNNHLNTLYHMMENKDIERAKHYIATISKPVMELKKVTWTGDDIVDVVLNSKINTMEKYGIEYHIDVEYPANTGILPSDLCTILSNLLDNAIDATHENTAVKGSVNIKMQSIRKFLLIEISNPSTPVIIGDTGVPLTSKNQSSLHGWGLQNVKQTTEKYNGSFQCEYSNGVFFTSVLLFYPQQKLVTN